MRVKRQKHYLMNFLHAASHKGWQSVLVGLMCSAFTYPIPSQPANAQETGYTPPPLFGGPSPTPPSESPLIRPFETQSQIPAPPEKKTTPSPKTTSRERAPLALPPPKTSIPAPENPEAASLKDQGVLVEPKPAPTFDTRGNAALEEAASVAERVDNPVQTVAPISTEVLLDHPADRIAEKAQPAIAAIEKKRTESSSIPELSGYDDTLPSSLSAPTSQTNQKTTTITRSQKPKVTTTTIEAKSRILKTNDTPSSDLKNERASAGDMIPRKAPAPPPPAPRKMPAVPPAHVQTSELPDLPTAPSTLPTDNIPALDENLLSSQLLSTSDTSVTKNPDTAAPPLPDLARIAAQDGILGNQHVLLVFSPSQTDLTEELQGRLDENVTPRLEKDTALRVEIRAYAAPDGDAQSSDRRISLARGLAVREHLKAKGIDTARIDVRAMGQNTTRKPVDRVDVVFLRNGTPL